MACPPSGPSPENIPCYNLSVHLILFDIDGTLLLSGGAGSRALNVSIRRLYGLDNAMDGIQPDGKTDPEIVREILARQGRWDGAQHPFPETLFPEYTAALEKELVNSVSFRVLPGARDLLTQLCDDSRFLVGLATGNIEVGARLKLKRGGLDSYFLFGGFGSDSEDRTRLIQIAIQRGLEKAAAAVPESVFVIGDTPRDILHGRAAGARTIAVSTGSYSLQELSPFKPDLALASLDPVEPVMQFLCS